jgi:hypothetical protein
MAALILGVYGQRHPYLRKLHILIVLFLYLFIPVRWCLQRPKSARLQDIPSLFMTINADVLRTSTKSKVQSVME